MIFIAENQSGDVIATQATHTLTQDDYNRLVPLLENKIKEHGSVSLYFEMSEFKEYATNSDVPQFTIDTTSDAQFDRIAVVGERRWKPALTDLMDSFESSEVRFFPTTQKGEALYWVKR